MSDSIRFFQEVVRYNLPQIPGRDMEKVSYLVVNAFMGLVNTICVDRPEALHDAAIVQEITQMFMKYLDLSDKLSQKKSDFI